MNRIAAVGVTYNKIALLKQCVEALQNQNHPSDILLVNNNFTNDTEQWGMQAVTLASN